MRSTSTPWMFAGAFVAFGIVVTLAVVTAPSRATARGQNGRIAFRRWFDNDHTWGAIFTINANGTGERQVTHPPKGVGDDQPDWAPDGSLLVFSRAYPNRPHEIYTVRPDGLALRQLTPACPKSIPGPKCSDDVVPSFSPDGRHIAFAGATRPTCLKPCGGAIIVTDRNGRNRRLLVTSKYELDDPQFSPDGKRVAFVHTRPRMESSIYVVDASGRHADRITPWSLSAGDNPDWSPDGKWILFRSNVTTDKQSQMYVIHRDGTGLRRLTHFKKGAIVTSSAFSPDGKWITFGTTGLGGNADVYVMHADGTGIRPVTRTKLWDSAPDWGPR